LAEFVVREIACRKAYCQVSDFKQSKITSRLGNRAKQMNWSVFGDSGITGNAPAGIGQGRSVDGN
jgi:hypothetical protein